MNKPKATAELLDQMIQTSEDLDRQKQLQDPSLPKGDGFFSFHLKLLRDDLLKEFIQSEKNDVDT
jgi:hypothetical protein